MSIKPIDLQTNMGQMTEVSKAEQTRHNALVEQQAMLDKQAAEKSNLVNTRLNESEKGEKTSIRDEDKKNDRQATGNRDDSGKKKEEPHPRDRMKDEKMGNIIDILK